MVGCLPIRLRRMRSLPRSKRGREGIEDAGVLNRFRCVTVHDAGAPYDAYVDADHQLYCAHVLRELTGVADTAPEAEWCWATQAADALVTIQKLVTEADRRRRRRPRPPGAR